MAIAMPQSPLAKPLPPLRAASDSKLQYSDVARYVGYSLRKDAFLRPAAPRAKLRPFSPPRMGATDGAGAHLQENLLFRFASPSGSAPATPAKPGLHGSVSDSALVTVATQAAADLGASSPAASSGKKPGVPRTARRPQSPVPQSEPPMPDAERREVVRKELIQLTGSARRAFRLLDVNNSGYVALGDFADGVSRIGVPWQKLTGLKRIRDFFVLFNTSRSGALDFAQLFPVEASQTPEVPRPSTPDYWSYWVRKNPTPPDAKRPASWNPPAPDDKLKILMDAQNYSAEVGVHKKWMKSTIRRLKGRGKSDSRCRELVAQHLPKGTGPADRQEVKSFTNTDVRELKARYSEAVHEPSRNITKMVYDMRDSRRVLQNFRQEFFTVAVEPILRKQADEERKRQVAQFQGLSMLSKVRDPEEPAQEESKDQGMSMATLSKEYSIEEEQLEDLCKEFLKCASNENESLTLKGFTKLLAVLDPKRTFPETDLNAWWKQVVVTAEVQKQAEKTGKPLNPKSLKATFEQFAKWFATSEVRMDHVKQGRSL